MNEDWITCAMCGYRFDGSAHQACQSCPLNRGCQLVCCPACGYETVDPGKSGLARLANRLFTRQKSRVEPAEPPQPDRRGQP